MWRYVAPMCAGILLVLGAAELACRIFPVSTATLTGYYLDPMVLSYPAGHHWQASTGWDLRRPQTLRANNLGFAAEVDFVPDPDAIGLVGDSYVEASMLRAQDRPAARLAAHLAADSPDRHRAVYAFGGPGSSLLDYAERMRFAQQRLGLRDFVLLLEPGDIRQSLCGSGNVHAACLDSVSFEPHIEPLPPPSAAKRLLRHSALVQYVAGQLKLDPVRLWRQAFPGVGTATAAAPQTLSEHTAAHSGPSARQTALLDAVTTAFFDRIRPLTVRQLVLVLDGRRTPSALSQAPMGPAGVMQERDAFMALAHRLGAVVVDAEPAYRSHWGRSTLSLSVSPQDDHLNPLAVDMVMRSAADALK